MGNIHTFTDHVRTIFGHVTTSLGAETSDTLWTSFVDAKNYDLIVGIGLVSGVASAKIITLTAYEATNTAGAGSSSLAITDTMTSSHTSDYDQLICQVRGEDITAAAYHYIGFGMATNDATCTGKGGVLTLQMRARYKQASLPA